MINVDRRQFIRCRLVAAARDFCFYLERKLGQLLLPVPPARSGPVAVPP